MGNVTIFRTSNPVDFTKVDGVYVDERTPPGAIRGIGNDVACVVGEFERGPVDVITEIGSTQELANTFGGYGPDAAGAAYKGYVALVGKQFGRLRVIRVSNSTQAIATKTLADSGATNVLKIDANARGVWGNQLAATISAASDGVAGKFDLSILRNGVEVEKHRNVNPALIADGGAYGLISDYVTLTRLAAGLVNGRPANATAQALTAGSDGTFADSDYIGSVNDVRGIQLLYGASAADIRWVFAAEKTSGAINTALHLLATQAQTKIAVIAGPLGNTPAQAVVDVASYRSDRVVYVYSHVDVFISESNGGAGGLVRVSPTSFAAAAMAALPPGRDPAGINAEPFLTGIRALEKPNLTRSDYESFKTHGILGLQFTAERQRFSFRSGRTASITPGLEDIKRRTITDYLQESIAAALVHFQNAPLSLVTKQAAGGTVASFLGEQVRLGILPSEEDLDFGTGQQLKPFEVDITSLNTPTQEAQGLFIIKIKVRIFAAAEFIVLRTEIGESVEILEQAA